MRKLYFTCALAGLSVEHRQRMIELRDSLSDSFEILEFCDPKELGARGIYHEDIHVNVRNADLLLSVVDERATGLGYEIGVAVEKYGIPTLAVASHSSVVTPILIGNYSECFELFRYDDPVHIKPKLLQFAQTHQERLPQYMYLVIVVPGNAMPGYGEPLPRMVSLDPDAVLLFARSIRSERNSDLFGAVVICRMKSGEIYAPFQVGEIAGPVVYKTFRMPGQQEWIEAVHFEFRQFVK